MGVSNLQFALVVTDRQKYVLVELNKHIENVLVPGKSGELGSWEEAEERLSHFASLMKEKGRGTVLSNTMKPEYCLQNDGNFVVLISLEPQ